ncbi:VOC family protein [Sphingosinicella sp. CPCC 101087]|uniref:VOC family protein n=1 Tax=Sphingosinicella sp. CPCC 101087 TaxID=2497754 RepID=UPI00101E1171|nr:VOC family protein [Sphingosinicella sp. CPCC 101087]
MRPAPTDPVLVLDHAWMAVREGGPERPMLEAAGFRFVPTINAHEGQGTASARIAFENGSFELIWPDNDVPELDGGAMAKARFARRADWRRSGDSPFGIGFRRTSATPPTFPFETWRVAAPWMGPGSSIEMLSPLDARTVTLFIASQGVDEAANRAAIAAGGAAAEPFLHPNGARRITGLRVSAPTRLALPPSASFVNLSWAAELRVGDEWLMELELDHGSQNQQVDFRPNVPLIVRF